MGETLFRCKYPLMQGYLRWVKNLSSGNFWLYGIVHDDDKYFVINYYIVCLFLCYKVYLCVCKVLGGSGPLEEIVYSRQSYMCNCSVCNNIYIWYITVQRSIIVYYMLMYIEDGCNKCVLMASKLINQTSQVYYIVILLYIYFSESVLCHNASDWSEP